MTKKTAAIIGVWIGLGAAGGAILGITLENIPVWTSVGAVIGVAIGASLSRRKWK